MTKFFLSCKKATELVERKHDNHLSLKDELQLKLHLIMCKTCNAYQKHSVLINQVLKKYFNVNNSYDFNAFKNNELKERIISKLSNK